MSVIESILRKRAGLDLWDPDTGAASQLGEGRPLSSAQKAFSNTPAARVAQSQHAARLANPGFSAQAAKYRTTSGARNALGIMPSPRQLGTGLSETSVAKIMGFLRKYLPKIR